jgi:hypothetical protein
MRGLKTLLPIIVLEARRPERSPSVRASSRAVTTLLKVIKMFSTKTPLIKLLWSSATTCAGVGRYGFSNVVAATCHRVNSSIKVAVTTRRACSIP